METKKMMVTALMAIAFASTGFSQVNLSTKTDGSGNLLSSVTLYADTTYILDEKVYVLEDRVINIQAGTVIKASFGTGLSAPALIITRGGKINAVGTADKPIIFTAEADDLDGTYPILTQGQWGGVLILGRATNNLLASNEYGVQDGEGTIEGLDIPDDRHHYGQDRWESDDPDLGANTPGDLKPGGDFDDEDNSGVMKYVSIRHGGAVIGTANEINGLTLGSVGRGTTLEHIEIISNQDDGIEFFGGTVDIKYATIAFCDDDYIDWDQGFSGRGQFILGVQLPESTTPAYAIEGDNGLEIDGDDDDTGNEPISDPVFYNVTMIGNGHDEGIEAKEGTRGTIVNSIFAGFDAGVDLNSDGTGRDGLQNWLAGTLVIENNTFLGNNVFVKSSGGTLTLADTTAFRNAGNIEATTDFIDYVLDINATNNSVTGGYNAVPSSAASVATDKLPPVDDFFASANYRGAFAPGQSPWTDEWSLSEVLGYDKSVVNCPTDTNGDGVTNVDDFLQLAGEYGNACAQ